MHLRSMGVDADLDRLHANIPDPRRLALADHDRVRLELHAELALHAGVFENLEEIFAEKDFAATECQNEDARIGHLVEQVLDLRCGHLAVILMVEIAMNASLVTAVSQIHLHAERDILRQGLLGHLLQQSTHRDSPPAGFSGTIGCSDIRRIPWPASSRARVSASRSASDASTS